MSYAETYALRFVAFEASKGASTYGNGNYGDGTYGQEATDPLTNVEFVLAAAPGQWPSSYGWEYHVNDVGPTFQAVLLTMDGPLALDAFTTAALVIERVSAGPRVIKAFPMTIDTVNRRLEYVWSDADLSEQGIYRVLVQAVSDSGRPLTVSGTDSAMLSVKAVT